VVAATEPMLRRPCRELLFSDGTTVVCDASHQWATVDKNSRRNPGRLARIITTADIERSLKVRGERNHQVPLAPAVRCGDLNLPVDPYVLGVWLGDRTSTKAEITCAE